MRKYVLLASAYLLSACLPSLEKNCGPYVADGRAWASAQKQDTQDAYRQYLADFPDGCFVADAAKRLKTAVMPKKVKKVTGGGTAIEAVAY